MKIFKHIFAAGLGFFPVAISPIDDPIFLVMVATSRWLFGQWGGMIVFILVWFILALIALVMLRSGVKWIKKLLHQDKKRKRVQWWQKPTRWAQHQAAKLEGAEMTFLAFFAGPVFTTPTIVAKRWKLRKSLISLALITLVSGSTWYLWYTLVFWRAMIAGWDLWWHIGK